MGEITAAAAHTSVVHLAGESDRPREDNVQVGDESVPPPMMPTGLAPPPPRLTREERLSLENLALKAENLRLQQERLKQDFLSSTKMLSALQKEAHEYQMGLDSKYGVRLAHCNIQSDGSIIPKAGSTTPLNGG